ncbi:MAG TPA: type II secretion system protein [Phycisphaerales bacterium]|nr:type II secretion system protein [Phycisphaerales bacterium]
MSKNKGLTLSEIVMALGLLTVISLAVIGVFTKLLSASTKNTDRTAAHLLAQSALDKAARQGPPDWGFGLSGSTGTASISDKLSTNNDQTETEFTTTITVGKVTDADPKIYLGNLYDVTVSVSWWGKKRQGLGRLSTETSRTVYIRQ